MKLGFWFECKEKVKVEKREWSGKREVLKVKLQWFMVVWKGVVKVVFWFVRGAFGVILGFENWDVFERKEWFRGMGECIREGSTGIRWIFEWEFLQVLKWLCYDGLDGMDGRDGKVRISENNCRGEMRVFRDVMKVLSRFEWYWVKWEWIIESIFKLNRSWMGENKS